MTAAETEAETAKTEEVAPRPVLAVKTVTLITRIGIRHLSANRRGRNSMEQTSPRTSHPSEESQQMKV